MLDSIPTLNLNLKDISGKIALDILRITCNLRDDIIPPDNISIIVNKFKQLMNEKEETEKNHIVEENTMNSLTPENEMQGEMQAEIITEKSEMDLESLQ